MKELSAVAFLAPSFLINNAQHRSSYPEMLQLRTWGGGVRG
jgi:hypothetical protein